MDLYKAHGTGNDFVVIPDLPGALDLAAADVRALCDRRTGIGADGVIRLGPPTDGGVVFMDYRNADGSIVEMCGNGVRVVARMAADLGLIELVDGVVVDVETRAGHRPVVITVVDGRAHSMEVDMGPENPDPAASGFTASMHADTHALRVGDQDVTVAITSMGNPHAVVVVPDVAAAPVATLGPLIETDPRWRDGVNVGFLEPTSRSTARLRVWERGVGETQACGTGACAALAVGRRLHLLDDVVTLDVPGGILGVRRDERGHLHLSGSAEVVAHMTVDAIWARDHGVSGLLAT